MLKKILAIFGLVMIIAACDQEKVRRETGGGLGEEERTPLFGTWQWVLSRGGPAGVVNTPEGTGIDRTINFTAGEFTETKNGVVDKMGPFDVYFGYSNVMSDSVDIVMMDRPYILISAANDTLRIMSDDWGALEEVFVRVPME